MGKTGSVEEITVKPEVMLLEQVLQEIASGKLRVPRFQRPFVWRPEQMLSLFDSIERAYPIGSLLVWETDTTIPSLDQVADHPIPEADPNRTTSFLLDGHQRLSTLFGGLRTRPTDRGPSNQDEWRWHIHRELGDTDEQAGRYRHWRRGNDAPPRCLPMSSVLRTMDFLAFGRRLEQAITDKDELAWLMAEAEEIAHRIKSYQIAVVRLKGGDLSHAVEVFSRLNSSGQAISPDQMVSALTYQPEGESLTDRIGQIRENLGPLGFGSTPPITIFRSILAVEGESDVQTARWDALARRVEDNLATAVDESEKALSRAAEFLRKEVGVPLARLVPYQHHLVLIATFFHHRPDPDRRQKDLLARWFWGTSWSGSFAGANSTQGKNALNTMRDFARGNGNDPWEQQEVRPFPDRFDLRSARVRAFVLWELREFSERRDAGGKPFDPLPGIERSDAQAYRHLTTKNTLSSHPADRLILPTPSGVSVQRALVRLLDEGRPSLLDGLGVPADAAQRLSASDPEGFVRRRAEFLRGREGAFMQTMGARKPEVGDGVTDIDTE